MTSPNAPNRHASAKILRRLLSAVVADPADHLDAPISNHLKSQASLAAFCDADLRIVGSSLNTLKSACMDIEGGFAGLDRLRKGALQALQTEADKQSTKPKTTKARLAIRVQELSADLAASREDLMLLSSMLERALRHGRQYAADSRNPVILERCAREQGEIRDMMTLRQTTPGKLKLVKGTNAA